jgi:hypothetical protein
LAREMSEDIDSLREELELRTTDELVSILRNRDEEEWRPVTFDVVASILRARGLSPEEVAAMGPEGTDVLESEPTVTIGRFFSPAEAHASRMALEEGGITAWVADEEGGTIYGFGIGARLQVRAKDLEAAQELLGQLTADGVPPEIAEPPCPACGSHNVTSEAWVDDDESARPRWRQTRRKWHYVCGDCREAWPAGDPTREP